jgi:hypothetical protein
LRGNSKVAATLGTPRRAWLFGLGLLLVGAGVYWYRRNRGSSDTRKESTKPDEVSAQRIVALYRSLESTLVVLGIPRPPSVPPWAHALGVGALGHPAAEEIRALTSIYLEARFGSLQLDEAERKRFSDRVRALRSLRPTESDAA